MNNFYDNNDKKIIKKFSEKGYLIFDIENKNNLLKIKNSINKIIKKSIKSNTINLETIHKNVEQSKLNEFRLKVYNQLNKNKEFKETYFSLASKHLNIICGNELVMQRKVNLSIQMPNDDSSLLPLHSDVWSGCSPYEVVLWVPMVDCKKTQSMFILPKKESDKMYDQMQKFSSVSNLEKKIKKKYKWLDIKFGQGLIFQHSIMHGNVVNNESTTRWSFNCRFKSLFSPYDDKSIGETFLPITIRPATVFGMNYKSPKVKNVRF